MSECMRYFNTFFLAFFREWALPRTIHPYTINNPIFLSFFLLRAKNKNCRRVFFKALLKVEKLATFLLILDVVAKILNTNRCRCSLKATEKRKKLISEIFYILLLVLNHITQFSHIHWRHLLTWVGRCWEKSSIFF